MPPKYTPQDFRAAKAMGISLEDAPDGMDAAVERMYNTLVVAYQHLDENALPSTKRCAKSGRPATTRGGLRLTVR